MLDHRHHCFSHFPRSSPSFSVFFPLFFHNKHHQLVRHQHNTKRPPFPSGPEQTANKQRRKKMEKKASKIQSSNAMGLGKTSSGGGSARKRATKKVISYFVWPVGFSLGCFIAYYVCYEIGLEFQMGLGLQFLLCSVLVHLFERWMPFESRWLQSDNEETCDCSYVFSAAIFEQLAGHLIGITAGPVCNYFWGDRSSRFWDQTPFVVQVVSGLVISEFGGYFSHRLFHIRSLPLWRFHAIHHSVSRLSWINSAHNHPIDMFKKVLVLFLIVLFFFHTLTVSAVVMGSVHLWGIEDEIQDATRSSTSTTNKNQEEEKGTSDQ